MPRYVVHVRSPKSPADAFAYMADLSNFAEWDPGVASVTQIEGDGRGPDAVFDLEVKGVVGTQTMQYRVTDYHEPTSLTATSTTSVLTSVDVITVTPDEGGCIVTYDADLTMNGILGIANPVLGLVFNRIGDRAANGLIRVLDGERTGAPTS